MMLYTLSTAGILLAIAMYLYPMFSKLLQHIDDSQSAYLSAQCFKRFIIAVFFSTFGAMALGYFITKNGLKSVQNFSNKMAKITANSLEERIDPEKFPKELQRLGRQFNHMIDRLQTSFKQLSQFSADIAHELRNPLHLLMTTTELALTKTKTVDEYRDILLSNYEEYLHLSRLIENLLFLAKADHGKAVLLKKQLNAKPEIENICDYYRASAEQRNIELTCDGDAVIFADSTLFRRVINNLLTNALKYTPDNGKIHILINHAQIAIKDTGIGISEEHLPNLFDRFYRVDPSRSTESGGLGLGLAIVKSIMNLHAGKISIESQLHQGTEVILAFS